MGKNTREDKCSFYAIDLHEFSNQQEENTSKMVHAYGHQLCIVVCDV